MDAGSTTFKANAYSWNRNANLLFFESPAGVGFSYYTGDQPVWNDVNTGSDNYEALKVFDDINIFKLWFSDQYFSDYKGRDFFITGESYAGMYIPYTAKAILDGNAGVPVADQIKLKGIAIGNGVLVMDDKFR
jgi:serine carboxypeptidase-like clade 2